MRSCALLLLVCACGSTPTIVSIDDAAADDGGMGDAHKQPPPVLDSSVPPVTGPDKLSETGLYSDFAQRTIAPGIIAYAPRYELWSDGATKTRYLLLPQGLKVDTSIMDGWVFPVGTKAWKEFRAGGKLVETRLMWKKTEVAWFEVAYLWTADGSDAIATPLGQKAALGTTHDVPSQTDCNNCHQNVIDTLIGVSALQLSNGGNGLLTALGAQGRLTKVPSGEFEVPGQGKVKDALSYLHANCAHCHNDNSKLRLQTALRLDVQTVDTTPADTGAYKSSFGLVMKHVVPTNVTIAVVPGNPDMSGLWLRMQHRRDGMEMPPLGTNEIDPTGVATIKAWIASLP